MRCETRTLWRRALGGMAIQFMLLLMQSPASRASQVTPIEAYTAAYSIQSQTSAQCPSASPWQNLAGPTVTVAIGGRTLHVPTSLPNFHADRDGSRNSIWFNFHISSKSQWSFGGANPDKPFLWEYLITIEVTSAPGRVEDKDFIPLFLSGDKKNDILSNGSKIYDVYPGVLGEKYVGKGQDGVILDCGDIDPSLKRKQAPIVWAMLGPGVTLP